MEMSTTKQSTDIKDISEFNLFHWKHCFYFKNLPKYDYHLNKYYIV